MLFNDHLMKYTMERMHVFISRRYRRKYVQQSELGHAVVYCVLGDSFFQVTHTASSECQLKNKYHGQMWPILQIVALEEWDLARSSTSLFDTKLGVTFDLVTSTAVMHRVSTGISSCFYTSRLGNSPG